MKNSIMFILGIVISLLFLVFPSPILEWFYDDNEFSNAMWNESLYFIAALATVGVAWLMALGFYYVIDSVRFSRWYHWLIMAGAAAIISPILVYILIDYVLSSGGYDLSTQLFNFCMRDVLIELMLFVVVSFSIRWWSVNCRHTPIRE